MAKKSYWKRKHKHSLAEILCAAGVFAIGAALTAVGVLPDVWYIGLPLHLVSYAMVGWRVLWRALRNIRHGQVFDENFLMSIATVGAFATGEYPEAVFVMLFYRVGELFEELAVGKSRASIASLLEIRPDYAHVEREGVFVTVDPAEVFVGDIIEIRPGERVPLDGTILEGVTTLDTAALTGESLPRDAAAGDAVISGCVNLSGVLRVEVARGFGESTVSRILELVENAGEHKSRSEHFITRFARYYTPAVVIAAVLLAVLPPVILDVGNAAVWGDWVYRAMSFLVISCPCALVISVPLSFFGGIGGASRRGILVKGSSYLEALAKCDTVVFDKTGTLTEGRFTVTGVEVASGAGVSGEALLSLAAATEQYSTHPIARALVEACTDRPTERDVDPASVEELAGHGVRARVPDRAGEMRTVSVGNRKLMESVVAGIDTLPQETDETAVYVAIDGHLAGRITVADRPKADSAAALADLRRAGIRETVMLTGDHVAVAARVASEVGVDTYRAELLPADKVTHVEALLSAPDRRGTLAFVGDGINDAPVLARADIGIAMGGMGSDAAIEAADIVLMDDRMSGLPVAIRIARKTLGIVRQNIVFALAVKAVVLVLGALGLSNLWFAVFADVGVAVLAILNAMRAMR